jgi:A/G-specific adenine glycosylase
MVDGRLARVRHAYTHFKLDLWIYRCVWQSGRVRLKGPVQFAWLKWEELKEYPIHRAVQKALPHIKAGLV